MKRHEKMYKSLGNAVANNDEIIDNIKGFTKKEEKEFYEQKAKDYISFSKWFLKEHYDLELEIPLKINGRLKRALGRFEYTVDSDNNEEAKKVQLSKDLVRYHTEEETHKVLIHELIHYALFTLDKPFDDGDEYFENELRKHNSTSNSDEPMRIIPTQPTKRKVRILTHQCQDCGLTFERRKDMTNSYRCRCGGQLEITDIREL